MFRLKARVIFSVFLFNFMLNLTLSHPLVDTYFKRRKELIQKSESYGIGSKIRLSAKEKSVNNILMDFKNSEMAIGFKNPEKFAGALHFFHARALMEQSGVFKIIQKLPKGSSLHSHDTALVSDKYVFENITYRKDLYAKDNKKDPIALKFFKKDPGPPWRAIEDCRQADKTFNTRLAKQMTLIVDNPEVVYPDITAVWTTFQNMFFTIEPLLTYKPVFKDYFYQALEELYEDNIRYFEFRGLLPELYDLDDCKYGPEAVLELYYNTSREFMKNHPDFWGIKFIFAPLRFVDNDVVEGYVEFVRKMNERFPNFIAGFDLVGREDIGPPLKNFITALLKMKQITKLFFHAGETNWFGLPADMNLFDAVLLNTTRIGHGYAALKHPELLKIIKEQKIAVEVSPISNQVLGLIKDLRNHPANYLIANDFPIVITQDDPSFWGAKGVSYDWYYAFMALSSRHNDLRLLKQLAINSIIYSTMDDELRERVMLKWNEDWDKFLDDVLSGKADSC